MIALGPGGSLHMLVTLESCLPSLRYGVQSFLEEFPWGGYVLQIRLSCRSFESHA